MGAVSERVRSSHRLGDRGRSALLPLSLGCLCVGLGAMVTRGRMEEGIAGLVASAAVLYVGIGSLRFRAVTFWIALTAIAFPFLRLPQQHSVVTFDRVWIIASLACLVHAAARPPATRATRLLSRALLWFVVAYGVRAALTPGSEIRALTTWFDAILLPAILFAVTRKEVRTRHHCERIAQAFMFLGAFLGALAVAERVLAFELASFSGGELFLDRAVGFRVSGPFTTPDVLAVCLLLCFAMTLFWLQANRDRLLLGGSVAVLELAGIVLTFFRGAWIAALIIAVVAYGLRPKRFERLGGVALVGLLIGIAVFVESYGSSQLGQRVANTQNVNSRIATYEQSFQLFRQNPIFGIGASQFTLSSQDVQPLNLVTFGGTNAIPYAHNSYLFVLAEQGLLGILPFLVLSYASGSLARRLLRLARSRVDTLFASALVAALLGYLLMSMELEMITALTSNALLAILLGAAAARVDHLAVSGGLWPNEKPAP